MWFLFGLFAGVVLSVVLSGGPNGGGGAAMGSIPLRCFLAIEESDDAYSRCRRPSIIGELAMGSNIEPGSSGMCAIAWNPRHRVDDSEKAKVTVAACDIEWHLALELRALKRLNELAREASTKR